jgi:hypothetical protein
MTLMIDSLVNSIRSSSVYNPDIQVAPACILWPDRERQFEAIIPVLQTALPELLVLGDYAPEKTYRSGNMASLCYCRNN